VGVIREVHYAGRNFTMTMGADRCLVDTNVLVYSTVDTCPQYREAREWLAGLHAQQVELCVAPQIVREYLVVLTRGDVFERQFTPEEALGELEGLLPSLVVLEETEETVRLLRDLVRRYRIRGKQIHDANIVATMMAHGVTRLVTYNPDDFRRFKEITLEPMKAVD